MYERWEVGDKFKFTFRKGILKKGEREDKIIKLKVFETQ